MSSSQTPFGCPTDYAEAYIARCSVPEDLSLGCIMSRRAVKPTGSHGIRQSEMMCRSVQAVVKSLSGGRGKCHVFW